MIVNPRDREHSKGASCFLRLLGCQLLSKPCNSKSTSIEGERVKLGGRGGGEGGVIVEDKSHLTPQGHRYSGGGELLQRHDCRFPLR